MSSNSRETTNFGEFWGHDWSLTQYMEEPESRQEHNFDFLPPTGARRYWISNQLVNAQEIRWNTIFDFLPPRQIQIVVLESF